MPLQPDEYAVLRSEDIHDAQMPRQRYGVTAPTELLSHVATRSHPSLIAFAEAPPAMTLAIPYVAAMLSRKTQRVQQRKTKRVRSAKKKRAVRGACGCAPENAFFTIRLATSSMLPPPPARRHAR
jgi:hypothetical protein